MSCDNVITVQDLEIDKKHSTFYREVITGKAGGTGADIDSATNAVTGQTQATLPKVLSNVGFSPAGFDFTTGGTLTERDKAIFYQADGNWYSWGGALPKVVPAASSPAATGGINKSAWTIRFDPQLRSELASASGAGLIGVGTGTTVARVLASSTTLADVGIFESAADNNAAINALSNNANLTMPVHGELRSIDSSSFSNIEHLVAAKVESGGVYRVHGVYPEMLGGRYSAAYNGGGQLAMLNAALNDPKFQHFGITFIGDSITWGTGSTGQSPSGSRDGTLSDPRNNASSCSYVNEFSRWLKNTLGINTTVSTSNHQYSASGESITTFTKPEYAFPKGDDYQFSKTGIASDNISETLSGPFLNARRAITVNGGGTGSLSFVMTGDSFTLIFGGLGNGAMYELLVNNVSKGVFSSRVGDNGVLLQNNQRRKHVFDYVVNGTVTIKVIQYGAETTNNALYIEGFYFERVIKVSNQGIIGANTSTYLSYNFPSSLAVASIKKLSEQSSWGEAATGIGATSISVSNVSASLSGEQRRYAYLANSGWDVTFSIPSGNDTVMIGYSSLSATGAIDVYADGVLVTRVHTSSLYDGNTGGYQKIKEVTVPNTTTNIKLSFIYENLSGGSTCYIYLEGVGYRKSADPTYPENNGFNDGVCLSIYDRFAFFQLGVNDRGNSRLKAPDVIRANLESMLKLLPLRCNPILMASPSASTGPTHLFDTKQVRSIIAKTALINKVDFIDNNSLFGECPLRYYTTDDLHPNDVGHALIARNITNAISCAS